ncbi:hypothetical protein [Streptomyces sp. NPDC060131]
MLRANGTRSISTRSMEVPFLVEIEFLVEIVVEIETGSAAP